MIDPSRALRQKVRACLAALALLTSVVVAAPAFAAAARSDQGLTTFGIKPSQAKASQSDGRGRFDYAATPGAALTDHVAVTNYAKTAVQLRVYASDGFNTAADGFDLLPGSRRPVDVGLWVSLAKGVVSLKPGATAVLPFTLKVPATATPGDHVGGIVASITTTEADKKGDRVAVDHRVGVRIYLRIQGALNPRLSVGGVTAHFHQSWNPFGSGKVTVSYTLHNVGNVRLGAAQSVRVAGWYGGTVQSPPISDVTELLPGNTHDERVTVTSVVPAFHNSAVVTAIPLPIGTDTDGQLTTINARVRFWAVPWAFLCLLFVVLLLSALLLRHRLRRPLATVAAPVADKDRKNVAVKP